MLIFFAAISSVNAQTVRLVETLPNGEHVVEIDGKQFRTISADHARQIEERKLELQKTSQERDLLVEQVNLLKQQNTLLARDAELADVKAKLERERADKFSQLYDNEQGLRLQAEKLIHRGRIASFFDSPILQIFTKAVVPGVQTWLGSRRQQ